MFLNKHTEDTPESILTKYISERVSPREVSTFVGKINNFAVLGVKIPKTPRNGPNRHFTAKSAKSYNRCMSVIDEGIRVKFDIQIENRDKICKLGQKGHHIFKTRFTFYSNLPNAL